MIKLLPVLNVKLKMDAVIIKKSSSSVTLVSEKTVAINVTPVLISIVRLVLMILKPVQFVNLMVLISEFIKSVPASA